MSSIISSFANENLNIGFKFFYLIFYIFTYYYLEKLWFNNLLNDRIHEHLLFVTINYIFMYNLKGLDQLFFKIITS